MSLPFERCFGNSAPCKILDLLFTNEGLSYSKIEIVKLAKISSRTFDRTMPNLVDESIIVKKKKKYETNTTARTRGLSKFVKAALLENLESMKRESKK